MDFKQRPAGLADLPVCARMLEGHNAYNCQLLALLPRVWKRLLERNAIVFEVLEDSASGSRGRILGFGASVFVTDQVMQEARTAQAPGLTDRLIRLESKGRGSPILDPAAAAEMNARDGVNVVIVHYCEAAGLGDGDLQKLRFAMLDAFVKMHRGYLVKEVLQEVWDEIDPSYMLHGWGRVRSDYAQWRVRTSGPPLGSGPYLIGLTREEAAAWPGSGGASIFVNVPAQLALSTGSKQLLRRAMLGETDAQLARSLHLSPSTVKSRWSVVYQSVYAVIPELLPESSATNGRTALQRGSEKRRRVVEYVSRHPEEFCLLPARTSKAAER